MLTPGQAEGKLNERVEYKKYQIITSHKVEDTYYFRIQIEGEANIRFFMVTKQGVFEIGVTN